MVSRGISFVLALVFCGCGGADSDAENPSVAGGECGIGSTSASEGSSCEPIAGTLMAHDFDSVAMGPGEERSELCESWTLDNDTEIWVQAVEMVNTGAYHHSNWLFVPEDKFDGPDGAWDCRDRGYSEVEAAIAGGVLYAQGTQATRDVQAFPDGVAIRIPPRSRIIGGTHLLNTRFEPVNTQMQLRLYTAAPETVTTPLTPLRMNYGALELPPRARSEFSAGCDFSSWHGPLTGDLYYVMPHYHYLGTDFRLELIGADGTTTSLYEDSGENTGHVFSSPLSLTDASGFRFSCSYENPTDEVVRFGIGDQEMCVMLGFTTSDWIFDGNVKAGEYLGADDEGLHQFEGDCTALGAPFSQDK